jgi:hypothetical protein
MHGYSNIPWDTFMERASLDTVRYDDPEEVSLLVHQNNRRVFVAVSLKPFFLANRIDFLR